MKKNSVLLLLLFSGTSALCQFTKKSSDTTPAKPLREMQTDRPDVTESAYSVDAGHFQVETDLFKRKTSRLGTIRYEEEIYNAINIKYGVSDQVDLQLVFDSFTASRSIEGGRSDEERFTPRQFTMRLKRNLFGNDGGKTALATMPFLSIGTQGGIGVGVVFPFAADLGAGWSFGCQGQFSHTTIEESTNEALVSATLGHDLGKRFNAFGEMVITSALNSRAQELSANGGLTFSVSDNVRFDSGFNYGLKKSVDRLWFIGFSFRY